MSLPQKFLLALSIMRQAESTGLVRLMSTPGLHKVYIPLNIHDYIPYTPPELAHQLLDAYWQRLYIAAPPYSRPMTHEDIDWHRRHGLAWPVYCRLLVTDGNMILNDFYDSGVD